LTERAAALILGRELPSSFQSSAAPSILGTGQPAAGLPKLINADRGVVKLAKS
jgi:hypothetical protein